MFHCHLPFFFFMGLYIMEKKQLSVISAVIKLLDWLFLSRKSVPHENKNVHLTCSAFTVMLSAVSFPPNKEKECLTARSATWDSGSALTCHSPFQLCLAKSCNWQVQERKGVIEMDVVISQSE